jgi:hypothetical protein
MATLKGYADDSRPGSIWVVAGYLGADHKWEAFDERWPKLLDKHQVPNPYTPNRDKKRTCACEQTVYIGSPPRGLQKPRLRIGRCP